MTGRTNIPVRLLPGRSRAGYGLPALVVVLFFVSVVVQAIVGSIARETTEARADAAFSVAKENLDTMKVTNNLPDAAAMPHLAGGSRYVDIDFVGGFMGLPPSMQATYSEGSARASALFEQKIRAYLNIPNADAIGIIEPDEIRREYPERVLRSGDRMAADLASNNIEGIATLVTGTAEAEDADARRFTGIDSTLLEAPNFEADHMRSDKLNVAIDTAARDFTSSRSIVSRVINAGGMSVPGDFETNTMSAQRIALTGQFAADNNLDDIDHLGFELIVADGVRAEDLYAGSFSAENIFGLPNSGEFVGGNPEVDIDPGSPSPIDQCMNQGNTFFECNFPDAEYPEFFPEEEEEEEDGDSGGAPLTPYQICSAIGMSEFLCNFYQDDFLRGNTLGYNECITEGGTPLLCEMFGGAGGGALGPNGDPLVPYDQCIFEGGNDEICSLFPRDFPQGPQEPVTDITYEQCTASGATHYFCTAFPTEANQCIGSLNCGLFEPVREDCEEFGGSEGFCNQLPLEYTGATIGQCVNAGGPDAYCDEFPNRFGQCVDEDGCDPDAQLMEVCRRNGVAPVFCKQFPSDGSVTYEEGTALGADTWPVPLETCMNNVQDLLPGVNESQESAMCYSSNRYMPADTPTYGQCSGANGPQGYCRNFPNAQMLCKPAEGCDTSLHYMEVCRNNGVAPVFCKKLPSDGSVARADDGSTLPLADCRQAVQVLLPGLPNDQAEAMCETTGRY